MYVSSSSFSFHHYCSLVLGIVGGGHVKVIAPNKDNNRPDLIDHGKVGCPEKRSRVQPETDARATDIPVVYDVGYCPSCEVL